MILILVGPSCCGKTTQAKILQNKFNFKPLISYTTRTMRQGETQGVDYHFITKSKFEEKLAQGFFFEHVSNFNNYYGSSLEDVNLCENTVTCLCIKGFEIVKNLFKEKTLGIYFMPPEKDILIKRFNERNSSLEEIQQRMNSIYTESDKYSHVFKHVIYPTTIENTTNQIIDILKTNHIVLTGFN